MKKLELRFTLDTYSTKKELPADEAALLESARAALKKAYAPYSGFKVGAAALLENGEILTGTNQENASFPAGICAEGTVFSAAASLFPDVAIRKLAITVKANSHVVDHPVAPCGICRQRILEHENRFKKPVRIIIMGEKGSVFAMDSVKVILPLYFSKSDL
ncbi:MAG: cytidine deaminase [Chitinophagales bacterium]